LVFIIFKIGYIRDMHIVQLLPELNQGGVERGTVELNRELVKRGHHSTVISTGGRLSSVIQDDGGDHITLNLCSKNPFTFFQRSYLLKQVFKRINPTLLHARSRVPAWLCWQANKSLKLPFITTVHGFNSVNAYSAIMTKGDHVITVSNAIKEYINSNYTHIDRDRCHVIHRGLDKDEFDLNKVDHNWIDQFQKKYSLKSHYIVTSVGRITQLKDYETFIQAIALLQKKIPHIKGLIVGGVNRDKTKYYRKLTSLVASHNLSDRIIFAGSQTNIREIYFLSDLIVSSSKKPESFGRTVVEAMAMDTPAIGTNHGGIAEILPQERLFEPQNINQLSQCINQIYKMPSQHYRDQTLDKFSLDTMVNQVLDVYNRVLKESPTCMMKK
jgi:glycosyltransferase involved in cell wall biosynthesis